MPETNRAYLLGDLISKLWEIVVQILLDPKYQLKWPNFLTKVIFFKRVAFVSSLGFRP